MRKTLSCKTSLVSMFITVLVATGLVGCSSWNAPGSGCFSGVETSLEAAQVWVDAVTSDDFDQACLVVSKDMGKEKGEALFSESKKLLANIGTITNTEIKSYAGQMGAGEEIQVTLSTDTGEHQYIFSAEIIVDRWYIFKFFDFNEFSEDEQSNG